MNAEEAISDISDALRGLYGVLGDGGSAQARLEEFCLLTSNFIHNHKDHQDQAKLVDLLKEYGEIT